MTLLDLCLSNLKGGLKSSAKDNGHDKESKEPYYDEDKLEEEHDVETGKVTIDQVF
jgi:hypothetical protein